LDNHQIIAQVREFKDTVEDLNRRHKDIHALIADLNSKLIAQDLDNAAVLISKKALKLKDRLVVARSALQKIQQCGEELDGNASGQDEEEFAQHLKG